VPYGTDPSLVRCYTSVFSMKRKESMNGVDEEQARRLAEELSELSRKQAEALQTAIYVTMSQEEIAVYEKRRARVIELCTLLGKYHPL
jgi:hypothetical protein